MSNSRRLLLAAASLVLASSTAQADYPQTLAGCLEASEDGWDHCVTIYPGSMCDNTYNIHWDLCHMQYAE